MTTASWFRAQRLTSHGLTDRSADALAVVRSLGAVQAQNAIAARWAIGSRSDSTTTHTIDELFETGDIVRTWTMRGTLHLVAAEDVEWMLALTSQRQRAAAARESAARGIQAADFDRASELIGEAVHLRGPLTRAEALDALESAGIYTGSERGYRFIRDAAMRGLVAWGGWRGKQQTLVPARRTMPIDRDEALALFLRRYLTGHSPATVRDFAWWSGLTLTDARRAREIAAGAVGSTVVDGVEWLHPAARDPQQLRGSDGGPGAAPAATGVHALTAWDEYVLGYGDRSPVLDAAHAPLVSATGNGIFRPVIIGRGRVIGTWRYETARTGVVAVAEPFTTLSMSERRGFDAAVRRLARFLGSSVAP